MAATGLVNMSLQGRKPSVWQGVLIVLLVILVYLPALHGGFVWDDDSWTTGIPDLLRDTSGLRLMWFQLTALQQYYPLSGTTFWLDYHLWKFWTTPYHVENVLLHALAALFFWRLLVRLQLPGAWLASTIFALHPVMAQSVAWITERKNVLSLVFYLGALLAYERYAPWVTRTEEITSVSDSSHGLRHRSLFYCLAFVLFLCALLAKTTAFSLPAVVLLIGWWKRGRIRWRGDVLSTLPFFALALGLGAVITWLEKHHAGAQGPDFAMTFPQRCLIAGQAFWFYLGKLLWPANLCFVYPRWQPNPGSWWQWLYPVTAIGTLLTLWLARGRVGRGPVTALFFYVGTLFPLLGFINGYGMRYSFVWNHWVYLPALGIIAMVATLVVWAVESLRTRAVVYGIAAIVLPTLALLTWQQAGMYIGKETLWRDTLAKNPDCWLAQNNLGVLLKSQGRTEEAMEHYRKAVQISPNYFESLNNLGVTLADTGRFDEAIENYHKAIQINPIYSEAMINLGDALAVKGRFDEAIDNYYKAIQIKPNSPGALNNLGFALAAKGRFKEAVESYREAIRIKPDKSETLNNLAWALATSPDDQLRDGVEAVRLAERACELTHYSVPSFIGTLAAAYAEARRFPEAVAMAEKAEKLATDTGQTAVAAKNRQLLELYRADKPYYERPMTKP